MVIARSYSLRIVFNNKQLVFFGQGHDRTHVSTLPKEMYRNNGLSFRGNCALDCVYIYGKIIVLNVNQNRGQTKQGDHLNR